MRVQRMGILGAEWGYGAGNGEGGVGARWRFQVVAGAKVRAALWGWAGEVFREALKTTIVLHYLGESADSYADGNLKVIRYLFRDGTGPAGARPRRDMHVGPGHRIMTSRNSLSFSFVGFVLLALLAQGSVLVHGQEGEWAWMGGSDHFTVPSGLSGVPGVYGTLGVAAPTNVPGGRIDAVRWTDPAGRLWLFGGQGFGAAQMGSWPQRGYLNDLWTFDPSTNEWTWVSGSDSVPGVGSGQAGVYGVQGTPAAGNVPGGRYGGAGWIDAGGNLWLFGGDGSDVNGQIGELNDLWEFSISSGEWTWMGGSQVVAGATSFGVYGTLGTPSAQSQPGARDHAAVWTDQNGAFWLFGGYGQDSAGSTGYLSDLWKFDPSSDEWAWIGGSQIVSQPGVYGSQGVPADSNVPGARYSAAAWTDAAGNFWLFGGTGYDTPSGSSVDGWWDFSDLWSFNPSTNQWTWVSGSSTNQDAPGIYGTLGQPDPANVPGARYDATAWFDSEQRLWLFGGYGYDSVGHIFDLNDVWRFDPSTDEWTWMGGSNKVGFGEAGPYPVAGVYGTLGVADPGNMPGGRQGAVVWTNGAGVWLFGGLGADNYSENGTRGNLNDLWLYQPPLDIPVISPAAGTYTSAQSVTISDANPAATIYYTTDGSTPTTSSTAYSGPITVSATETIQAIAVANGYINSAVASATFTINLPPTFSFGAASSSLSFSAGQSGTMNLTVTPQNGFNSAVTFACSGLPAGTSCSFNPTSVTPSGGPVTTTLTIAASASASNGMPGRNPFLPGATLAVAGCLLFWRKRGWVVRLSCVVLVCAGLLTVSACSGASSGGSGGGTPPPTQANVTVTATSGSLQQTATIALTITH